MSLLKSYGTDIEWNGINFDKKTEWTRYDSIGDSIQTTCSPLYKQFPNITKSKLSDLEDVMWNFNNVSSVIYYVHTILHNEYAEILLDMIMNSIYPKTDKIDYFSTTFLLKFIEYCNVNKFTAQERKLAIEMVLDGKEYTSIKFEKINNSETEELVNTVMKDVDYNDIIKKPALINYYVGQVMKLSKGKAPVNLIKELIEQKVKNANEGLK